MLPLVFKEKAGIAILICRTEKAVVPEQVEPHPVRNQIKGLQCLVRELNVLVGKQLCFVVTHPDNRLALGGNDGLKGQSVHRKVMGRRVFPGERRLENGSIPPGITITSGADQVNRTAGYRQRLPDVHGDSREACKKRYQKQCSHVIPFSASYNSNKCALFRNSISSSTAVSTSCR